MEHELMDMVHRTFDDTVDETVTPLDRGEPMLSIYSSEVPIESLDRHGPYYFSKDFVPLTLTHFTESDEFKLFLINITIKVVKVQHFIVVIKKGTKYFNMGFGAGPFHNYVLKSPDPYMKYVSKMDHPKIKNKALNEFQPLNTFADPLNRLLQAYRRGGYIRFGNGMTGFFANSGKKYNIFRNMCLSGFESIFPIPTSKLRMLERMCLYRATGRYGGKRRRTKRRQLSRK